MNIAAATLHRRAIVASIAAIAVMSIALAQSDRLKSGYSDRPNGADALSIALPADTIQLYKDGNFKDDVKQIDGVVAKNENAKPLDLPGSLNDSLTSLRWNLPAGIVVVFYEDSGARGEQLVLWGSGQIESLAKFDFNDKASRWAWFYLGGTDTKPARAMAVEGLRPVNTEAPAINIMDDTMQLHRDKNYKGTMGQISPVTATAPNGLQRLPEGQADSLTSLRWNLPPGVVVVFYQDAGGTKQQAAIFGRGQIDDVDLWDFNDKASRWSWHYIGAK